MEDNTGVQGEGTAADAAVGSPGTQAGADSAGVGEEGSGESEQTVRVGERDVPVSQLENALKVHERFTQESTDRAQKRKDIEAREARLLEEEAAVSGYRRIADKLRDPRVVQALEAVDPSFRELVPGETDVATQRVIAENIGLRYKLFMSGNPGLSDDQLSAVRKESLRLAQTGQVDSAVDFDSIAYRLFHDDMIAQAAERRAAEIIAAAKDKERKTREAGTSGPGVAALPKGLDPSKMTPVEKMELGRQMAARKAGKR